jgi:hypothetical protein
MHREMTTDPPPTNVSSPPAKEAFWVTQFRLVLPLVLGAAAFVTGLFTKDLLWIGIGASLIGIPGLVSAVSPRSQPSTGSS